MSENSNEAFNPADHTIAEVEAYLKENPDQVQAVLDAEKARGDDARSTLVKSLEEQVAGSPKFSEPQAVTVSPGSADSDVETKSILGENYSVTPNKGYRLVAGEPAKGDS